MGSKSRKRTESRSSVVPVEEGVSKKSGGGIAGLPAGYGELLGEIKARIARSRIEAALAANHALIDLYWHIGRSIVERQKIQGWGKSVVERLARDIQAAFPGISGFSRNNIWRMRAFYLAYTEEVTNLARPVQDSSASNAPIPVKQLPWGQNIELLQRLRDPVRRFWYAQEALEHGWSRAVLVHQIKSRLYERQGNAVILLPDDLDEPLYPRGGAFRRILKGLGSQQPGNQT